MHRRHAHVIGAAAVAAALGCHARGLTATTLQPAFATTFANLVATEERRLGLPSLDASLLRASAACHRTGPGAATEGSGDWVCTVTWSAPRHGGALHDTYELQVTPDGCFAATADGAEAHVGGPTLTSKQGLVVPNLVYAFDGCFDTT